MSFSLTRYIVSENFGYTRVVIFSVLFLKGPEYPRGWFFLVPEAVFYLLQPSVMFYRFPVEIPFKRLQERYRHWDFRLYR